MAGMFWEIAAEGVQGKDMPGEAVTEFAFVFGCVASVLVFISGEPKIYDVLPDDAEDADGPCLTGFWRRDAFVFEPACV